VIDDISLESTGTSVTN